MKSQTAITLYVLLMIGVVFAVDFLFLRHRFWPRLLVNVGIVLIFGVIYLVLRNHR